MKVLLLSNLLSYGGASKLIRDLMPLFAEAGHVCDLLILTDEGSTYADELRGRGFVVDALPKNIKGHIAKIRYIADYIAKGGYDVVHANLFPVTYYVSLIRRFGGRTPVVMTEHSTDNRRRRIPALRPLERLIYGGYDHVISISDATQENLLKWLGRANDGRFSVVENGIDVPRFAGAQAIAREELLPGCRPDDVLMGMVASFTPQKNHAGMFEALALLPERYKLLLAGEGPMLDDMKAKAEAVGVAGRVAFLGFRRDVPGFMKGVDLLVIPSLWEGFGLVAAEAMACGTPVAASDIDGLSEVVGACGVKFDPKNPENMRDAILKLEDAALVKRLTDAGRARAARYDIRDMRDGYLGIYRRGIRD